MMEGTPPAQTPPAMPTAEDAKAIFDRATQAAERAESAASRLEAASGAAGAETRDRFPDMPDALVKQISDATARATVDAMGREYELRQQAQEPAPPTSDDGGTTKPGDGPSGEPAPAAEPPAERPSIARRILGY